MHCRVVGQIVDSMFWSTADNLAKRANSYRCCQLYSPTTKTATPKPHSKCGPNAHDAVSARLRPLAINEQAPWKPAKAPPHTAFPILWIRALGPLAAPIHQAIDKYAYCEGYLTLRKTKAQRNTNKPFTPVLTVTSVVFYDTEQAARSVLTAQVAGSPKQGTGQKEPTRRLID